MSRQQFSTNTPWERAVGYSRAVRVDRFVFVCGTTASDEDGNTLAVGDAGGQTRIVLQRIADALREVGAGLEHVVRTRMFVTDISRWEEIGRAHGEVFGEIRPAATMVEVAELVNPDHLVEVEADAILPE